MIITNEQMNQCKNALLKRQSELIKQVQNHFGLENQATDSIGELSSYDNHPGDMGTELYERGKDSALNEHAEKELEKINEALHSINDGTYGICSKCGIGISFERLLAVPTTDRCKSHADDQTFTRDHPVEEEVFSPNINPDEVTKEVQVGYDAEDTWQELSQYGSSETPSDFYGDRDNYNEMYPNKSENVGAVEDLEEFLSADMEGKFSGVTTNQNKYDGDF